MQKNKWKRKQKSFSTYWWLCFFN